jgi:hypothetical protein
MTQADRVHSTPPTNTSRSRRAVLAGIVSAAALPVVAAIPTAAPALPGSDSELIELADQYVKVQERWSVLADEEAELELVRYAGRYEALPKSAAYRKIRCECKKLVAEMRRLEQRIVALQAATVRGMQAKVWCVKAFHNGALEIDEEEASGRFALSIMQDIVAKTAGAA